MQVDTTFGGLIQINCSNACWRRSLGEISASLQKPASSLMKRSMWLDTRLALCVVLWDLKLWLAQKSSTEAGACCCDWQYVWWCGCTGFRGWYTRLAINVDCSGLCHVTNITYASFVAIKENLRQELTIYKAKEGNKDFRVKIVEQIVESEDVNFYLSLLGLEMPLESQSIAFKMLIEHWVTVCGFS